MLIFSFLLVGITLVVAQTSIFQFFPSWLGIAVVRDRQGVEFLVDHEGRDFVDGHVRGDGDHFGAHGVGNLGSGYAFDLRFEQRRGGQGHEAVQQGEKRGDGQAFLQKLWLKGSPKALEGLFLS